MQQQARLSPSVFVQSDARPERDGRAADTFVTATQPHLFLPRTLEHANGTLFLSRHQTLLRHQIEVFEATEKEAHAPSRGRSRRIRVGQVGIRRRHCKHVSPFQRQRGSMYFPCSTTGIYQASQNMSSTHLQCGLCQAMPEQLRQYYAELIPTIMTDFMAGRPYFGPAANETYRRYKLDRTKR
jgi:hypothetical protein